ncbi:MAG: glycosyl transferase family 1 [Candidatus Woesebacteria bacterium GW2011_GWB1_45_5]|uniref:Glycosyl transferase family 1 n=1 Tax=Candidatus Woesebacteria bacterium GW2011_GWB1_45_5 TaxID=1618581 RepID=A0A0G1MQZ4_9BACT|nr:MAG: glycosyl transferase family 1 [Candidatus Woesebacteria bacterium GW2011_GWB1_45_5]
MKIAFLNIYQNKVGRGAETFVRELSGRLAINHSVDVISDVSYAELFKKNYDLIIPTNGRLQSILVRVITRLKGARVIISGQSGPGFDDRLNLLTFPDAFVGLTEFQAEWARKANPFVKVVKIPNGVDLQKFNAEDKGKDKSAAHENRIVLSVGAFTKEKRHDLTIRAVAKLQNVKLIIAGGGGDRKEEIRKLGEGLLGDRFGILSVPGGKMPGIYKRGDLFVYPTVPWESFGIAIVEAMATNLPVVANDDPIRREIAGGAGLFVDPANTNSYAKALKEALNKNWGDKPRRQAEKFDWDRIALEYEKLFKELA